MDIHGKVVIITGASEGIGLATAHLFATHGAKLVLAARSTDKLNALAREFRDQNVEALPITTDMRDKDSVNHMVGTAHAHFTHLDVLINNAGQSHYASIEKVDAAAYQQIIELNLFGVLYAMQAVIPIMRAQGGGVIINISSNVSKMAIPNIGAYASTKYALNGLSLTARNELAADNIRVCLMHPGMTATDFGKNSLLIPGDPPPFSGASAFVNRPVPDSPQAVAEKILKAAQDEPAEQFMDSYPGAPAPASSAAQT